MLLSATILFVVIWAGSIVALPLLLISMAKPSGVH